jgi:hypothetical protein
MSKRIDQLTPATDVQVAMPTWMWCVGDPATGQLYSATTAQLSAMFSGGGMSSTKYVAIGSEGTALTIPALSGKTIQSIAREGMVMYQVSSSPDTAEFIWDGTDITLGLATNPGERFLILYSI